MDYYEQAESLRETCSGDPVLEERCMHMEEEVDVEVEVDVDVCEEVDDVFEDEEKLCSGVKPSSIYRQRAPVNPTNILLLEVNDKPSSSSNKPSSSSSVGDESKLRVVYNNLVSEVVDNLPISISSFSKALVNVDRCRGCSTTEEGRTTVEPIRSRSSGSSQMEEDDGYLSGYNSPRSTEHTTLNVPTLRKLSTFF